MKNNDAMALKKKNALLVSSCLLGEQVRYNGSDLRIADELLQEIEKRFDVISVCPELSGGLPVPRPPAEISGGDGYGVLDGEAKVRTAEGEDLTNQFVDGAQKALELCTQHSVKVALLTERSPSCGSRLIYDGSFMGKKIPGTGVTTALLERAGVKVVNLDSLQELLKEGGSFK